MSTETHIAATVRKHFKEAWKALGREAQPYVGSPSSSNKRTLLVPIEPLNIQYNGIDHVGGVVAQAVKNEYPSGILYIGGLTVSMDWDENLFKVMLTFYSSQT